VLIQSHHDPDFTGERERGMHSGRSELLYTTGPQGALKALNRRFRKPSKLEIKRIGGLSIRGAVAIKT